MKILITGAMGLLGSNLCVMYSQDHEVVAVGRTLPDNPGCDCRVLDVTRVRDMKLVQELKPDMIVNCAALVNVDYLEDHPDEAILVNAKGAENIARAAKEAGSYLVHISTDAVFDGEKGGYTEEDETAPLNVYGKSKLEGERLVEEVGGDYVILRTNIYGWNRQEKNSLAEWMLRRLEGGERLPAFRDIRFTPILVNNLGRAIMDLYRLRHRGILNVAGSETCTKLDFALKLADVFGLDKGQIDPVDSDTVRFRAKRAKDMGLNTGKAQELLSTPLLGIEEGLAEFRELRDSGYVERLRR